MSHSLTPALFDLGLVQLVWGTGGVFESVITAGLLQRDLRARRLHVTGVRRVKTTPWSSTALAGVTARGCWRHSCSRCAGRVTRRSLRITRATWLLPAVAGSGPENIFPRCTRRVTIPLITIVPGTCSHLETRILRAQGRSRCLAESEAKYKVPFKFTKIQDEYFLKHGVGGGKRQPPAVLHKTMQIFLENIAAKDMTDTLDFMRARWGSVNGFLDHAGFDAAARAGLRAACCGSAAL